MFSDSEYQLATICIQLMAAWNAAHPAQLYENPGRFIEQAISLLTACEERRAKGK